MSVYSTFVKHVTFPLVQRREGIKGVRRHLRELEKSQWLSRDEIERIQFDRTIALLRHAYDNTIYYRRVMDEVGMTPDDVREPSHIRRLPVLTKDIIRNNRDDLAASNLSREEIHFSETGGTTGVKMKFCRDNACLAPKMAATIRQERWTGWDIGKPRGLVWPAEQDYVGYHSWKAKLRNALGDRYCVLPAAVLDDEKIGPYVQQMKKQKPVLVRGFASPLYLVAKYMLRVGETGVSVPAVISTGEPLHKHQRNAMEEAFHAEVFDSYGAREVALIAQECPEHAGMHISAESLFVEIADTDTDGRGKVLVTDLLNYGMPFIRYDIGDTGSLSDRTCPCGRGLPLMDMGVGREADIMFTPAGSAVSSATLVLYLVDNGPSVGQVQIIQDAIDHLLIRITKDPPPGDGLFEHYRNEVARLFGDQMRTTFDLVDDIENESSGKYRFAICAVPDEDRPAEYRETAGDQTDE